MDMQMILMSAAVGLLLLLVVLAFVLLARQSRGMHQAADGTDEAIRLTGEALNAIDAQAQELEQLNRGQQYLSGRLESLGQQLMLFSTTQNESLTRMDRRMEQVQTASQTALENIRQSNERQLNEMRRTVDEKLT